MDEGDEQYEQPVRGKKQPAAPENYRRNQIKKARLSGEAYTSHKNKEIAALDVGPPCKCRAKCFENLDDENIRLAFDYFRNQNNFSTKDEQDIFLHGLIEIVPVKRVRKNAKENRSNSYQYHVLNGSERVKVCLHAFLSIYAVTAKRVRRLRDLKLNLRAVKDRRGQHTSYTLPENTKFLIKEHIASFPTRTSHYSNKDVKFLDSELNVRLMYNLFKEKHPELKVSYSSYWLIFRQEFNLRFGQPQIDTCCTCEELGVKIRSPHLNDAAKRVATAELLVHKRKAKKYYNCIRQETTDAKNHVNENVLAISIDYMSNISLPKIPVQELFYLRQLTAYSFGITNIKSNRSTIFCYHEGQAKRGPDEVCSFLSHYLNNTPADTYDQLHVYADNCGGQNKNHSVVRLLLALTDKGRFKRIKLFFPIVGHSYSPCDREFSIIKRFIRKHNRFYTVPQLISLVTKSSPKFTVVEASSAMITAFQSWWPKYYKKTVISQETKEKKIKADKVPFGISSLYQFNFNSQDKGLVVGMPTINSVVTHSFRLSKNTRINVELPSDVLYPIIGVPIKLNKMGDIEKTLPYIPDQHKEYYNDILANSMASFEEALFENSD